jgi:diaminobutyrate-2-oxoglutarate transaminase
VHVFEQLESQVRSYCRAFPTVFEKAEGHLLWDEGGKAYIDFFSGAGSLNYGHNNPVLKKSLLRYIESDGVVHSLDMATTAKRRFLERFNEVILVPRRLRYKIQFPGPTGTNAVEAALKLARKYTGRSGVIAFTNAYHGLTLGALAVTADHGKRAVAGVPLLATQRMPFDGYIPGVDSLAYIRTLLDDPGSGLEQPAAIILETVQIEGGINVASSEWLRGLQTLAREREILLIVDDIQTGCGRTGSFFSFEPSGIEPDMVCLSKSISGYGLPMSLLLLKPEIDVWKPGEHSGTFRGNNLAFVAGEAALAYWEDGAFASEVARKAQIVEDRIDGIVRRLPPGTAQRRGRGLVQGIAFERPELGKAVSQEAFRRGLIAETAGARDAVLKVLPPLTIDDGGLADGLDRVEESVAAVLGV